jgi:zinc transport system permease protein
VLLLSSLPPALSGAAWLERAIAAFSGSFPDGSFWAAEWNVRALLALVLVSVSCGAVGSLVVGSRMAFFSDALAHCAFAGVSLGFLVFHFLLSGVVPAEHFWRWVTPIMVAFGGLVGLGIAWVRGRTGLASDTVIGVFFAGAIGLAAALRTIIRKNPTTSRIFSLEDFLFGDPINVNEDLLVALAVLAVVTLVVLAFIYNFLLLSSFNPSLALSRRVPVRLANYLFVVLLALIVNMCLRCVGALLINALLIVPAAAAVNLSRNMRQLFWLTIALCLAVSLGGQALSWEVSARYDAPVGVPGTVVLLSVVVFFASMAVGPWLRNRAGARAAS